MLSRRRARGEEGREEGKERLNEAAASSRRVSTRNPRAGRTFADRGGDVREERGKEGEDGGEGKG